MGRFVAIPPKQRFPLHFQKVASGCWEWTASIFKASGYGSFGAGKTADGKPRKVYAHRYAYEIYKGPIPAGLQVLHRCDNRRCVNPAHLFLGTQRDNIHDMFAKGRGRPQGKPQLSSEQIAAIRATPPGASKHLAEQYGVTTTHIRRLRRPNSLRCHDQENARG